MINSGHKEGDHNAGRHNGDFKATGNILGNKLRSGYMAVLSYYITVINDIFHLYCVNIYRLWTDSLRSSIFTEIPSSCVRYMLQTDARIK